MLYVQAQVQPPSVLIIQRQPKREGRQHSAAFPPSQQWCRHLGPGGMQPPPCRLWLCPPGPGAQAWPLLQPGGKPEPLARDWRTDHQFMILSCKKELGESIFLNFLFQSPKSHGQTILNIPGYSPMHQLPWLARGYSQSSGRRVNSACIIYPL